MPRCEGRPEGACPFNKNDRSVRNSQGDLMLCGDCERYRFPYVSTASSSSSSTGGARVTRSEKSTVKAAGATVKTSSSANSPAVGASCERSTKKKQSVTQNAGATTGMTTDTVAVSYTHLTLPTILRV